MSKANRTKDHQRKGPDVLTALKYDTCEKLESCQSCMGVRKMAIEALEEAVKFIEGFAANAESGFARRQRAIHWLRKVRGDEPQ